MAIELSIATANDSSLAANEVQRGKAGSGHAAHGVMSFLAQLGAAAGHAKAASATAAAAAKAGSPSHASAKPSVLAGHAGSKAPTAGDSALVLAQLRLNLAAQNASPQMRAASAASRTQAELRGAKDPAASSASDATDASDASPAAKTPAGASQASSADTNADAAGAASPVDASTALAGNGLLPLTGLTPLSSPVSAASEPASAAGAVAASASRGAAHTALLSDASETAAAAPSSAVTTALTSAVEASADAATAAAPAALDKRAHSFAATPRASADTSSPETAVASPGVQTSAAGAVTDLEQRLHALSSLAGGEAGSGSKSVTAVGTGSGIGATHQSGPSWSLSSLSTAPTANPSASLTAGASGTVSEQQVAAQVTMWASQNIKSAELKLDAHGKDPVEVSISMTGNQAQVHFRSDVAQTRELLTRSAAALDSSMQREGLVLTGMTVGTSAQGRDNAGASGENASSGGKSVLRAVATVDAVSTVSASRTPQGALDLFV